MNPAQAAKRWDELKTALRRACLLERRRRLQLVTQAYRRQVFRLKLALKKATRRQDRGPATVTSVTTNFELLALDEQERVQALRRSLIAIRRKLLARRQRAKFAQYAGQGPTSTRAFFKRISVKFAARMPASLPADPTKPTMLADRLAVDWQPITQHPPQDSAHQDAFFERLPPKRTQPSMTTLDDDFTVEEVAAALKSCPRGKACGPDGIPNDWYRDQLDVLPELLAPLYSSWHRAQCLPTSFTQATVYCIPKSSRPQTGLDFRPIALLNTDYKIYARLLLNRVRPHLPALVAETQFGFVPGRQVHDAIDTWTAARRLVMENQASSTAIALMLDFAKAYDTLDRTFLLRTLRRHGFTDTFVGAVGAMHLATTATYLADGSESASCDVSTGIRQGCPLAPVLFILALDTLYELVQNDPRIHGIQLMEEQTLKVAGFADDTSLFLNDPSEEQFCIDDLHCFGNASGLRVNLSKCRSLYLHPHGHSDGVEERRIEPLALTQHLRHLGAQIASDPNRAYVWELTLQQLRARLALAQEKTMNLLQRVQICRAVILPKLLFVGRHSWPSKATIDKLQKIVHNYAWHGILTASSTHGRAWLNHDTASLPASEGGLGLPNLLHEFELLAAKVTSRWAAPVTGFQACVGAIMLWKPHRRTAHTPAIQSARTPAPAIRYGDTVTTTGERVIRAVTAQPRTPTETDLISEAWHSDKSGDPPESWDERWLYLSVADSREALALLAKHQAETHGVFQAASLWAADISLTELLIDPTGAAMGRIDFCGATAGGATVGDIVEMEYCGPWQVRCRHKLSTRQLHGRKAAGFVLLCQALVYNYPEVVLPQSPSSYLHPRPPTLDRWALQQSNMGVELVWEPAQGVTRLLGLVRSSADATRLARQAAPGFGMFIDHPWLEATAAIWAHPRQRLTARRCRREIVRAARDRGAHIVHAKTQQSRREDAVLAAPLDRLSWRDLTRLAHATSSQQLLLTRLKHMRLGGWDRVHNTRGCPHCPDAGAEAATTFHTVWHCPQARRLWQQQRDEWRQRGGWTTQAEDGQFQEACMSLWLTRVPEQVWQTHALRQLQSPDEHTMQAVFETMNELWQRQCLLTIQIRWRWRCGLHDPHNKWSAAQALAMHATGAKAAIQSMIDSQHKHREQSLILQLLTELSTWFPRPEPMANPSTGGRHFVLFLDGGSRGNPGPGGAGAVIVATDDKGLTASIVWAAAMSYARPDMTNNRAEYLGAIAGLTMAATKQWTPLEVVGDSALILRQLREYRTPKNTHLRPLYARARRLADTLGVAHWVHHFRAHNKMADAAANIAMDARGSAQVFFPTTRPDIQQLEALVAGDFGQWQVGTHTRRQNSS